jgi:putative oligomerization/nucleic acid binding protein/phospholipase D-like protein
MFFAEWQVGQFLWSMIWFTLFFLWIWVVVMVFADIFRSPDLSGWGKALWTLFVICLPWLGILAYLIARGGKMAEHRIREKQATDEAMQDYIRTTVASTPSTPASDLNALVDLRDRGVIDEAEFEAMKQRVVAS